MTSEYEFTPENQSVTMKTTPVPLGGDVLVSSVKATIIDSKGWGGSIIGSRAIKIFTTRYNEQICNEWEIVTQVNPNRFVLYEGAGTSGGRWIYKSDTMIKVKVSWNPYVSPPEPVVPDTNYSPDQDGYQENNPPLDLLDELNLAYGEEWITETRIVEQGFNLKCIDYYDRDTLGIGERRALS